MITYFYLGDEKPMSLGEIRNLFFDSTQTHGRKRVMYTASLRYGQPNPVVITPDRVISIINNNLDADLIVNEYEDYIEIVDPKKLAECTSFREDY